MAESLGQPNPEQTNPNVAGGGEDYFRPRTPEEFVLHAAESMAAIAVVEAEVLAPGATADNSVMAVDPSNKARTITSPPLPGWSVGFEHKRYLEADREEQVVTVRRDPPMPDAFDQDGLTATRAAVLWSEYETEKARAPHYVWGELQPHVVTRVQDGIAVPLGELPIDDIVSAKEDLRNAAVLTALARGRNDVVRQLTKHE